MDELIQRLEAAASELWRMHCDASRDGHRAESWRLRGKADGCGLALSYARDIQAREARG